MLKTSSQILNVCDIGHAFPMEEKLQTAGLYLTKACQVLWMGALKGLQQLATNLTASCLPA